MIDTAKIVEAKEAKQEMHPALDVVDGTLYVGVRVPYEAGVKDIILTSKREALDPAELGVSLDLSHATPAMRWNPRKWLDGDTDPVTFGEVYQDIYTALDARLTVPDPGYLADMTLFIMMSYFVPLFDVLPVLWLRGMQSSGKSRAATAIGHLAFNGMISGAPTEAILFRTSDAGQYTQVLTEMDTLAARQSGERLLQLLQTSTSKGEAWVNVAEQTASGGYTPKKYYGFVPRVLCSTTDFKSAPLKSRCIRLDLQSSPNADQNKLALSVNDERVWAPIRDKLYRLQLGCTGDVPNWLYAAEVLNGLGQEWRGEGAPKGRTRDKWFPLVTLAELSGVEAEAKNRALAGMADFYETASGNLDALLMQFTAWLVREEKDPVEKTPGEMRKALLRGQPEHERDRAPIVPDWAKDLGLQVDVDYLRQHVSERSIGGALRRLKLVPDRAPRNGNKGALYTLDPAAIKAQVEASLGPIDPIEADQIPVGENDPPTPFFSGLWLADIRAERAACDHEFVGNGNPLMLGEVPVIESQQCRKCGKRRTYADHAALSGDEAGPGESGRLRWGQGKDVTEALSQATLNGDDVTVGDDAESNIVTP
jgi:hypothetical protein